MPADTPALVVTVGTRSCLMCRETGEVEVPVAAWTAYRNGALAQDAFRMLDAPEREQIITGTHPACWDRLMSGE